MPDNKKQHYVPKFYFKQFSEDGIRIHMFNFNRETEQHIPLKEQCAEDYFYCTDTRLEKILSNLEGLAKAVIKKVIDNETISVLDERDTMMIKSWILLQHGRTKDAGDANTQMANHLFNILKPEILSNPEMKAKGITQEKLDKMQLVTNHPTNLTLLYSMMSGILIQDMEIALLINQSSSEFIFGDAPVVFFNSYLTGRIKGGKMGYQSRGLQIFYPLNHKLLLFIYDSTVYKLHGNNGLLKITHNSDIDVINDLALLSSNENVYFHDSKMGRIISRRFSSIKNSRQGEKIEVEKIKAYTKDDEQREIYRCSRTEVKYSFQPSFLILRPFDLNIPLIRDTRLAKAHNWVMNKFEKKEITSVDELIKAYQYALANVNNPHE